MKIFSPFFSKQRHEYCWSKPIDAGINPALSLVWPSINPSGVQSTTAMLLGLRVMLLRGISLCGSAAALGQGSTQCVRGLIGTQHLPCLVLLEKAHEWGVTLPSSQLYWHWGKISSCISDSSCSHTLLIIASKAFFQKYISFGKKPTFCSAWLKKGKNLRISGKK